MGPDQRGFQNAAERAGEARAAYLAEASGPDEELRREVESLLQQGSGSELRSPVHEADCVGREVAHFRILEKLGGVGMGAVYEAQDLKLDRLVALKFLPHEISAEEEHKRHFIHEAKAALALDHSNICTIYEIDEADGRTFIAMEFVDGQTEVVDFTTPRGFYTQDPPTTLAVFVPVRPYHAASRPCDWRSRLLVCSPRYLHQIVGGRAMRALPVRKATTTQITADPATQFDPSNSGNVVVLTDDRNGNDEAYCIDLADPREAQVTRDPGDQELQDVSGNRIVTHSGLLLGLGMLPYKPDVGDIGRILEAVA